MNYSDYETYKNKRIYLARLIAKYSYAFNIEESSSDFVKRLGFAQVDYWIDKIHYHQNRNLLDW